MSQQENPRGPQQNNEQDEAQKTFQKVQQMHRTWERTDGSDRVAAVAKEYIDDSTVNQAEESQVIKKADQTLSMAALVSADYQTVYNEEIFDKFDETERAILIQEYRQEARNFLKSEVGNYEAAGLTEEDVLRQGFVTYDRALDTNETQQIQAWLDAEQNGTLQLDATLNNLAKDWNEKYGLQLDTTHSNILRTQMQNMLSSNTLSQKVICSQEALNAAQLLSEDPETFSAETKSLIVNTVRSKKLSDLKTNNATIQKFMEQHPNATMDDWKKAIEASREAHRLAGQTATPSTASSTTTGAKRGTIPSTGTPSQQTVSPSSQTPSNQGHQTPPSTPKESKSENLEEAKKTYQKEFESYHPDHMSDANANTEEFSSTIVPEEQPSEYAQATTEDYYSVDKILEGHKENNTEDLSKEASDGSINSGTSNASTGSTSSKNSTTSSASNGAGTASTIGGATSSGTGTTSSLGTMLNGGASSGGSLPVDPTAVFDVDAVNDLTNLFETYGDMTQSTGLFRQDAAVRTLTFFTGDLAPAINMISMGAKLGKKGYDIAYDQWLTNSKNASTQGYRDKIKEARGKLQSNNARERYEARQSIREAKAQNRFEKHQQKKFGADRSKWDRQTIKPTQRKAFDKTFKGKVLTKINNSPIAKALGKVFGLKAKLQQAALKFGAHLVKVGAIGYLKFAVITVGLGFIILFVYFTFVSIGGIFSSFQPEYAQNAINNLNILDKYYAEAVKNEILLDYAERDDETGNTIIEAGSISANSDYDSHNYETLILLEDAELNFVDERGQSIPNGNNVLPIFAAFKYRTGAEIDKGSYVAASAYARLMYWKTHTVKEEEGIGTTEAHTDFVEDCGCKTYRHEITSSTKDHPMLPHDSKSVCSDIYSFEENTGEQDTCYYIVTNNLTCGLAGSGAGGRGNGSLGVTNASTPIEDLDQEEDDIHHCGPKSEITSGEAYFAIRYRWKSISYQNMIYDTKGATWDYKRIKNTSERVYDSYYYEVYRMVPVGTEIDSNGEEVIIYEDEYVDTVYNTHPSMMGYDVHYRARCGLFSHVHTSDCLYSGLKLGCYYSNRGYSTQHDTSKHPEGLPEDYICSRQYGYSCTDHQHTSDCFVEDCYLPPHVHDDTVMWKDVEINGEIYSVPYTPCYEVKIYCNGHCPSHVTPQRTIECQMEVENIVKQDNLIFTEDSLTFGYDVLQWAGTLEQNFTEWKREFDKYWDDILHPTENRLFTLTGIDTDSDDPPPNFYDTYVNDVRYGSELLNNEPKLYKNYGDTSTKGIFYNTDGMYTHWNRTFSLVNEDGQTYYPLRALDSVAYGPVATFKSALINNFTSNANNLNGRVRHKTKIDSPLIPAWYDEILEKHQVASKYLEGNTIASEYLSPFILDAFTLEGDTPVFRNGWGFYDREQVLIPIDEDHPISENTYQWEWCIDPELFTDTVGTYRDGYQAAVDYFYDELGLYFNNGAVSSTTELPSNSALSDVLTALEGVDSQISQNQLPSMEQAFRMFLRELTGIPNYTIQYARMNAKAPERESQMLGNLSGGGDFEVDEYTLLARNYLHWNEDYENDRTWEDGVSEVYYYTYVICKVGDVSGNYGAGEQYYYCLVHDRLSPTAFRITIMSQEELELFDRSLPIHP